MRVLLNTGSTLGQGQCIKGYSKLSERYLGETAVCFINWVDYHELGEPERVEVKTKYGVVVLRAKKDNRMLQGQVFVPRGLWANQLIGGETGDYGNPRYKGLEAVLQPTDEQVHDISEILKELRK